MTQEWQQTNENMGKDPVTQESNEITFAENDSIPHGTTS